MEKQFFTWVDCDVQGTELIIFYDVTLKINLGDAEKGSKFFSASIDYEKGRMEFYDSNNKVVLGPFELIFTIRE